MNQLSNDEIRFKHFDKNRNSHEAFTLAPTEILMCVIVRHLLCHANAYMCKTFRPIKTQHALGGRIEQLLTRTFSSYDTGAHILYRPSLI